MFLLNFVLKATCNLCQLVWQGSSFSGRELCALWEFTFGLRDMCFLSFCQGIAQCEAVQCPILNKFNNGIMEWTNIESFGNLSCWNNFGDNWFLTWKLMLRIQGPFPQQPHKYEVLHVHVLGFLIYHDLPTYRHVFPLQCVAVPLTRYAVGSRTSTYTHRPKIAVGSLLSCSLCLVACPLAETF